MISAQLDKTKGQARAGLAGYWRALEQWRRSYTRGSLIYTRNVNHRIGSLLALALLSTRVGANAVTVFAVAVMGAGSAFLASRQSPLGATGMLVLLGIWQLGFALDCADGQLARARGTTGPFGAFLDQLCDFLSHGAVFCALTLYLTRTLSLSAVAAVCVFAGTYGTNLLQLFTSSLRNALLPQPKGSEPGTAAKLPALAAGRHLSDWGGFLLLAALLTLAPRALLGLAALAALLSLATASGQLVLNWRRSLRGQL